METAKNAAVESCKIAAKTDRPSNNDDIREELEERHRGTLMTPNELADLGYADLVSWLKEITMFGNLNRTMLFFRMDDGADKGSSHIRAIFYTAEKCYSISAHSENGSPVGMMAWESCRKLRPGACRPKISDLPEGPFSRHTFDRIVRKIVACEIKNLQCWKNH